MTGPVTQHKTLKKPVGPLWERIKATVSLLTPSMVSWVSGELKHLADEVRELEHELRLLRKGGRNKKQHESICAALVILRETAARKGLTHADKDKALELAAEALEGAL